MMCNECLHFNVCSKSNVYCDPIACRDYMSRTALTNLQRDLALALMEKAELRNKLEKLNQNRITE